MKYDRGQVSAVQRNIALSSNMTINTILKNKQSIVINGLAYNSRTGPS
jgi:hypothetical protein